MESGAGRQVAPGEDRAPQRGRSADFARLRQLVAAAEQPDILAGLGRPKDARCFWIANAIAARLSPTKIRKAAESDAVKYIYPAGKMPERRGTRRVAEVLEPAPCRPFSLDGKTIPWNLRKVKADQAWAKRKATLLGE